MDNVTSSGIDWQAIYAIAGLLATVITIIFGPKAATKARSIHKTTIQNDITDLEGLLTKLETTNVKLAKLLQYYKGRYGKAEKRREEAERRAAHYQTTIKTLEEKIDKIQIHKQVVKRKMVGTYQNNSTFSGGAS